MSVFDVKCQKCNSDCRILGHKIKPRQIPVFTREIAMKVARYCGKCNKVICGGCAGITAQTLGHTFVECPYCGSKLLFATPTDVKKSKAKRKSFRFW